MPDDNEEEKKVQCVRCGREQSEKHKYCISCGAPLANVCTRKSSPLHKGCGKKNDPDARFCATCGSPTVFNEEGLI